MIFPTKPALLLFGFLSIFALAASAVINNYTISAASIDTGVIPVTEADLNNTTASYDLITGAADQQFNLTNASNSTMDPWNKTATRQDYTGMGGISTLSPAPTPTPSP